MSRLTRVIVLEPKIIRSQIGQAIKSLKDGKASGADEITGEVLKTMETVGEDVRRQ